MTATVEPERILKELRKLWIDLGKEQEHGVLRACAMTLIAATGEQDDDQVLGEMIASLMHEHPSRAIVLKVRDGAELEARVFAQCWMPFGKRQQICCEQVEITSSKASLDDAAALIAGIVVPDLPVVLYLRTPSLLANAELKPVLPLASKVVVDSSRSSECVRMLDALARMRLDNPRRADLGWARLTPWREAVAQLFDRPEARRAVKDLQLVRILHADSSAPVSAYYLGGWFRHVAGRRLAIEISRKPGPAYDGISGIEVRGAGGFEAALELGDDCAVDLRMNGATQRLVFPPDQEDVALREELSIAGADPVYDAVLTLAAELRGITK